jgi:chromosome segregation ATPase
MLLKQQEPVGAERTDVKKAELKRTLDDQDGELSRAYARLREAQDWLKKTSTELGETRAANGEAIRELQQRNERQASRIEDLEALNGNGLARIDELIGMVDSLEEAYAVLSDQYLSLLVQRNGVEA